MRKTKIICTLGPSTDNIEVLRGLINAGMNVARINFSHGTHEEQKKRIDMVKQLREEMKVPLAIMLDTKGPEIRVGTFKNKTVVLEENQIFTLTSEEVEGDNEKVSVSYPELIENIEPGTKILIDDGLIELEVINIEGKNIRCRVKNGGQLSDRKSINLPGININMPYMNERDRADILFGIENDIDYIAASFVRNAFDVIEIKKIIESKNASNIRIISKIENNEGVVNIDDIIKISDGIMIARGDMGVEIPFEELPRIQKMLIKKCYYEGKPVITATQMLESMIKNPRPTRAEVTDIANAIYDGTSAIMLSGETAAGLYPIKSVSTMARIAETTESSINYRSRFKNSELDAHTTTNAISHATCTTAIDLDATAIITVSQSGYTARMISKFRPACPIISTTVDFKVYNQLSLSWGVIPVMNEMQSTTDELFESSVNRALETGIVKNGDLVIITGGSPVGVSGTTNILKVHLVGDVLVSGTSINSKSISGEICVAKDAKDAIKNFKEGDILVIPFTTNDLLPVLKNTSGIICEEEGTSSHAAIAGLMLDIPVIVGAKNACKILKNGTVITIDGLHGMVYSGVVKSGRKDQNKE